MFCPLGAMKLGVDKKGTASDSVKPGPHIHVFLGSKVLCIYLKLSLAEKIFIQNHPRHQKI